MVLSGNRSERTEEERERRIEVITLAKREGLMGKITVVRRSRCDFKICWVVDW